METDAFCVLKINPTTFQVDIIDICDTLIHAKNQLDIACKDYLDNHHLVIENEKRINVYKKNIGYIYTNKELVCIFDIESYLI